MSRNNQYDDSQRISTTKSAGSRFFEVLMIAGALVVPLFFALESESAEGLMHWIDPGYTTSESVASAHGNADPARGIALDSSGSSSANASAGQTVNKEATGSLIVSDETDIPGPKTIIATSLLDGEQETVTLAENDTVTLKLSPAGYRVIGEIGDKSFPLGEVTIAKGRKSTLDMEIDL